MNQEDSGCFYPESNFVVNNNNGVLVSIYGNGRVPVCDIFSKTLKDAALCRSYMCNSGLNRLAVPPYPIDCPLSTAASSTSPTEQPLYHQINGETSSNTNMSSSLKLHTRPFNCFPNTSGNMALEATNPEASIIHGSDLKSSSPMREPLHNNQHNLLNPSAKLQKRPFKCFPKNSIQMALDAANAEAILTGSYTSSASAEDYAKFRSKMLSQIQNDSVSSTNKNMRRYSSTTDGRTSEQSEYSDYLEKREKNNQAARRSREARKIKEDELAIRCAFLEQENIRLKFKLSELERERNMLQIMMYH